MCSASSLTVLYIPDVDEGKKCGSQKPMANDSVLRTDRATVLYSPVL